MKAAKAACLLEFAMTTRVAVVEVTIRPLTELFYLVLIIGKPI